MQPSVFTCLHVRIQRGLEELGITEPTPPQMKVIPPILEGDNILLVAPTASGKTEAALLPVFDMFLRDRPEGGISIIYITPLRALNRDIHRRMMFWADHLGIKVQVRHGDTTQKERRQQVRKPPEMLITTPETLQAILPTKGMGPHLKTVRWLIIDEIHDLAASKRGAQLTLGMERLEEVAPGFQRIGLSATVGSPETVAGFLGGVHHVKTVEVEVDKSYVYNVEFPKPTDEDFDLSDELNTSPKAASRLNRIRKLVREHNSTLIFVQGRGQAESLGYKLKQLEKGIEVHHGSLSREQRHRVEDEFKEGELNAIVCTSTLQLGIDVGEVDLCIQYLSPRQVSALIQRVGRAGHKLSRLSRGVTIPAYGEDSLESLVTSEMARRKDLEPTVVHMKPLDVLAHQIVGLTLSNENGISLQRLHGLVRRAYPYREYTMDELDELTVFMHQIGLITRRGEALKNRGKGRRYYYENLGMINDERRYPFINAITDEMVGTVGDEFWSLRARVGLNVILRGRVWRILQIDEERGVLHALPSTDPLGALPGWDGELIPVSREVAEEAGRLREKIGEAVDSGGVAELAESLEADEQSLREVADETILHLKSGVPVPTPEELVLEVYDRYLVIHSSHGGNMNRTLGAILDAALTEKDLIYAWWNDPYRILIEMPNKINRDDMDQIQGIMDSLNDTEADRLLLEFMEARFPFGYMMKFIAERFGVLPRGKIMGPDRIENLYYRFKDTPIYKETIREAYQEKLDLGGVKELIQGIRDGSVNVTVKKVSDPSVLARHILEKYADVEELMATDATITDQLKYMKESIESRSVNLACVNCGEWHQRIRIREMDQNPQCENCSSGLLAMMRRHQSPEYFQGLLRRWKEGEELFGDDMDQLVHGRKTADMILSYGRKAVEALMVHGVGPVTSYQVLSRMHRSEEEFYKDLLKAKIQYMKTRQYWADK
ncbi:MAG: DEAD/DEAH box helicase [Candidatus Bathyarchaeota archaeon]|nr:DEAD/DEAH box helicase [Candidatus Bathyarchaeota archaeon]